MDGIEKGFVPISDGEWIKTNKIRKYSYKLQAKTQRSL